MQFDIQQQQQQQQQHRINQQGQLQQDLPSILSLQADLLIFNNNQVIFIKAIHKGAERKAASSSSTTTLSR
jgi:hypothetical protein